MEIFKKAKNILLKTKNNFLKFFLNKRFATLLLLFFVISGLVLPNTSYAGVQDALSSFFDWATGDCGAGMPAPQHMTPSQRESYQKCLLGQSGQLQSIDESLGKVEDKLHILDKAAKGVLMAIIIGVITLLILFITTLSSMMGSLFLWVFSAGSTISYTGFDNPAIAAGWPIVRDLANMIVVLGFVVIGLATILRFHDYEAKKLLPKLIIAALLINFSLVICGVFIDASNITMHGLGNESGGYLQKTWTENTSGTIRVMWENFDIDKPAESLGISIGLVFTEMMRFVIYSLFFFLFLARYISLWILVILSPLAFVAAVFPASQKFYNMWKSNFIQWCIIGIPASFFLWLSDKISSGMISSNATASSTAGSAVSFMAFLIPGFFMILGFLFSLQTSAMGASMITSRASNYFNKGKSALGGLATSGAKKIGGGSIAKLAGATGLSGLYGKARDTITKQMEDRGLLTAGHTSKRREKNVSAFDFANATDEQLQRASKRGFGLESEKDRDKRAAAIIEMQKRNKLDLLPKEEREKAVNFAISRGGLGTKEMFEKSHQELTTGVTDQDAINRAKSNEVKRLMTADGLSREDAQKAVDTNKDIDINGKTYSGYKPSDLVIQNTKDAIIKEKATQKKVGFSVSSRKDAIDQLKENKKLDLEYAGGYTPKQINEELVKFEESLTEDEIEKTRNNLDRNRMQEKSLGYESSTLKDGRQKLISDKIEDLKKKGWSGSFLDNKVQAYEKTINPADIRKATELLNKENKIKAIKKLGYSKLQELSKEAIDADVLSYADSGSFKSAFPRLSGEQTDKYREVRETAAKNIIEEIRGTTTGASLLALWGKTDPDVDDIFLILDDLKNSADSSERKVAESLEGRVKNIVTTYGKED